MKIYFTFLSFLFFSSLTYGQINNNNFNLGSQFADFMMKRGSADTNWKRALVAWPTRLDINYNGDFTDGVVVQGSKLVVNGNLGVGTTDPLERLHILSESSNAITWPVIANNSFNGSTTDEYGVGIKLKHSVNSETSKWSGIASINEGGWANNSSLAIYTDATEKIRILSNGNLGVGTTDPTAKLEVSKPGTIGAKFNEAGSVFKLTDGGTTTMIMDGNEIYSNHDLHVGSSKDLYFKTNVIPTGSSTSMIIKKNGNVGVGTTNPMERLHILSESSNAITWPVIANNSFNSSTTDEYGVGIKLKHSVNSETSKWSGIASINEGGWANNSSLAIYTDATEKIRILSNGNVGIGITNPTSKLTIDGKILCEEVKVVANITAPDYVFQKYYTGTSKLKEDYTMPTLEEVEAFTKANHHLPEVPSAEAMKEGMQLKEMTTILLQKVEELTLYTIEQEKDLNLHKDALKEQKDKNKALELRLKKLEQLLLQSNK